MDEDENELKEKSLRRSFCAIFKGCSEVIIEAPPSSSFFVEGSQKTIAYAKHFSFFDQIELDKVYQKAFDSAAEKGLPTRRENLDSLDEQGIWTKQDEQSWLSKKNYLDTLKKTKAKLMVPSQADAVQVQIDQIWNEVIELDSKRDSLIGQTCESYAKSILNSHTIVNSLYKTEALEKLLIPKEDLDYLDNTDLGVLISCYNKGVEGLDIESIKKMSISGFFTSYFAIVEKSPLSMFNASTVCELTFYQLNLLSYAKVLRSIIRNTDPPKHLLEDPDSLLEWSEKGEKQRKVMEKAKNKDKSFSMVGASEDDYDALGADRKGESIFARAKKKGGEGELGIMDFVDN